MRGRDVAEARPDYDIHDLPNWLRRIEKDIEAAEKRLVALEKGAPARPASGDGDVVVKVVGKGANAALEKSVEDLRGEVAKLKDRPVAAVADPALAQAVRAIEERTRRLEGLEQQLVKLEAKIKPGQSYPSATPGVSVPASTGGDDGLRAELEVLRRELRALATRPVNAPSGIGANPAALAELEARLQRVETRKAAPTMTVKGKEIPIEVSGIVAGLIAIGIGAMVLITGESVSLISQPLFVVGIGVLIIGAGVVKALLLAKQNAVSPPKPRLAKK